MGFAPTPEQYKAYEYASWHEKGKKAVPAWGGARDTFWTNVNRGQEILRRISAVGGASDSTELRQKELEQSPAYIAEQQRLADENIAARLAEISRLALIEKNRLAVIAENQRIENKRLQEIENQRIEYERIEEEKRIRRINELQEIENQRLQEIENQKIIPAVVATSALIPLGIIGLLLYTSMGKK